ncbi:hypothetical protein RF55_4729 [Lasius niger]|uniref:Uncharacterized protein n=1 Tax=Lasius niger TaxID=67767 RepID=A0A0J7KXP7_LASNI|nr:hypothetical protein RF55_4729 [Lasius niger]
MELYKRMPVNGYKEYAGYHRGDFCSNCGQNEYEDALRSIATRKRRTKRYEKHCPSCHCPPERRRSSPSGGPRTLENVEAMLNRYERVFAEPVSSTIKKSQSSPLSQKIYWHDCQTGAHSRCPRKSLQQARRQRRTEHDRYLCRMKGDTVNSELINEDVEACSKYAQAAPIKTSLKRHNHLREPEGSPDEQEYSEAESEVSAKYAPCVRQSRKREEKESRIINPHLGSSRRHQGVGGDGEYIAEMRNVESDVDCRRNARQYQEARKLVLELEELERLRMTGEATAATRVNEDEKRLDGRRHDVVARATKQKRSGDESSALIKESIDGSAKKLALNGPAHLAKLDLHATKTRILESIDHMLDTMDDAKNDAPMRQEETEQETIEKITRELQENGWQLLFNALTIHRNSTDSSKRTVRLECLNHIRQQLDKLYALESTLDNCPLKLQSLSNHVISCNEEHQQTQQLEHKIADS